MIVVSNASPLINLSCIDKLDLLQKLYQNILIPEAVYREVVITGRGQPGSEEVKSAKWIEKQKIKDKYLFMALTQYLSEGEAETIILALEFNADLVIIDEKIGRQTASHFGLNYIGLVGVLKEAKVKGLIKEVKRYLDELRNIAGFWLKNDLYQSILEDEQE